MGLDMYLNATRSFSAFEYEGPEKRKEFDYVANAIGMLDKEDKGSPYMTVDMTIGYWRKANAIHGWFHRECGEPDNDISFGVSRDKLEKLMADCYKELGRKPELVPASVSSAYAIETDDVMSAIKDIIAVESHKKEFTNEDDTDPLRPTSGFFFGSTEKDEWYYIELLETIKIINKALSLGKEWYFHYNASY